MIHAITARRAALATGWAGAAVLACLLLAGCGPGGKASSVASAHPTAAAAASSARAAGHAEASSSGGQAIKKSAAQVADACRPAGGWNDMYPGVTGAAAARHAFITCEKIPRSQVFAWGVCAGKAYSDAPKGAAPGTPAENTRQGFLATAFGQCTQTARKAGGKS